MSFKKGASGRVKLAVFLLAVAVSLVAASYRHGDSAHSIGLIKAEGGKALHASSLAPGHDSYMLIATATVIPPYRGDARIALEGANDIPYEVYLSGPVVDLGIRNFPKLINGTLHGLKPMDRLAMWVYMKPPKVDPVCGMAREEGFLSHEYEGRQYHFCAEGCLEAFKAEPAKYAGRDEFTGSYTLALYDTKTDMKVLSVPIEFGKGGAQDGGHVH